MSYTKYIDALAMMDNVVENSDSEQVHKLWDDLYTFVFANFKIPESYRDNDLEDRSRTGITVTPEVEEELGSMREMFSLNREELEAKLYEIPPVILEQCFPVWMARYMLAFCCVPVSPLTLTTWMEFHRMYGYMVIYSYSYR